MASTSIANGRLGGRCCALTESSGSQVTPRRREMDSNHWYPAEFFLLPRQSPQFTLRNINRLPRDGHPEPSFPVMRACARVD